jgi:lysozyme
LDEKKIKEKQPVSRRAKNKTPFFRESVTLYPTYFSRGCFGSTSLPQWSGYYFSFKSNKVLHQEEDKRISDVRNLQVLDNHAGKAIGFDVSEYQGKINWVMWIPWK